MALVNAINNPLIDDTYNKLQFRIEDSENSYSDVDYREPANKKSQTSSNKKRKTVSFDV
jgi:hypothetical protein